MNKTNKLPFEDYLLDSQDEEIIWIKGKAFIVRLATDNDIERIGKGYFTMSNTEPTASSR
ncbi:hypothetical protein [Cohnella luojiensis]|uniref:Uncharacterized protein n=1 Tax=Cohnella luojiensis TaxID=652876 RepID=A0A4Y8LU77_9BACL|nr:hypothetical protein [Cohnella luojiensis]TFE24990.1 hypothetical protein E2980_14630 [Cohnella luojiensis]